MGTINKRLIIIAISCVLAMFTLIFGTIHIGVVITTGSVAYLHVFVPLSILDIPFMIYIIIFTPVILPFVIYLLISTSFACVFFSPFIYKICGFPNRSSDLSNLFCPQFNPQIFPLLLMGIFMFFHLLCLFRFTLFSNPKVRSKNFLHMISWPATFIFTVCAYSIFFMPILSWLPGIYSQILFFIPFVLSCFALYQTIIKNSTWIEVDISMCNNENENGKISSNHTSPFNDKDFHRVPYKRNSLRSQSHQNNIIKKHNNDNTKRFLRIVHFTDLHLGCFLDSDGMSKLCSKAVDLNPDLVILTGDYFTYESEKMPGYLSKSLEPLKSLSGKTFACLGNHDIWSGFPPAEKDGTIAPVKLETIKSLDKVGVKLLVDEATTINTSIGPVQMIGFDFHLFTSPKENIYSNFFQNNNTPNTNIPRIALLHDPQDFKFFPDQRILTFSGHTHGGTLGLLSLGYNWVIPPKKLMPFPHGLWSAGSNKLYVNCGLVCRFMFGNLLARLGIPNEAAVINVWYD